MKKILILAGEQSGLTFARGIKDALPASYETKGYSDWGFSTADMAVMGFWPVLRRLFFFLGVRRTMMKAIRSWRPDAVVTVDYPGMNIPLAAYAKKLGIRTLHVVSPQVWAWKKGKIPKIERSFDRLCCFFPFEPSYYRPGFAVFVGHPILDSFKDIHPVARKESALAVLPGSRIYEIERHMPVLMKALDLLPRGISVTIPAANGRVRKVIEKFTAGRAGITVTDGGARDALLGSTCAVVASGTATLEAALAGCPTVLVYKVGRITEFIVRRMIKGTKYAGLANIIWDKCGGKTPQPMPELLQSDFTPSNVAGHLAKWMEDESARRETSQRLKAAVSLLESDGGSIKRIVNEVLAL